jgi:hypothetical protein
MFWEELIPPTFLDTTLTALKTCPTILLLLSVCIRYRGNVSTEPLPSNDKGIFTEPSRYLATKAGLHIPTHRLMEGIFN